MQKFLPFIFSLIVISSDAQVSDNFNDGDFASWSGDTADFIVNAAKQLQLNASATGSSALILPVNTGTGQNIEWDFYIHEDFSPSSSNYAKVYLLSDNPSLSQSLNGYFLRFGEALSSDAIELFRQNGTAITSICRAGEGRIAAPFEAGVRVRYDSTGTWRIFVDYTGGTDYLPEAANTDTVAVNGSYMGIECVYTSGNAGKFYFDDFYCGSLIQDTIPPFISAIVPTSDSSLAISFSEPVQDTTVLNSTHYSVSNGIGSPYTVLYDSINNRYTLYFTNHFSPAVIYGLTAEHVRDQSQNEMIQEVLTFEFVPVITASPHDVVINEVYFAPSGVSPLPNSEYVEIYNRKDSAIDISGWTISDASSDGLIGSFTIQPHEYVLLFDSNDSLKFTDVVNGIAVNDFPSLNNDGDHITLTDNGGQVIDDLSFDPGSYADDNKDDGGWSIERVDPDFTCVNEGNWRASASSFHGTPGVVNSVKNIFADNISPYVINAYLNDSTDLIILTSEPVRNAEDKNNYRITRAEGLQVNADGVWSAGDSVIIHFNSPLAGGIYSLALSENITDCPGNAFNTFHTVQFGYPDKAQPGDVIINELLFYCSDGSNDFVEIYNRSGKIIDLCNWTIAEASVTDITDVSESAKISASPKLLFPGQYLVLSENQQKLLRDYVCKDQYAFEDVKSMPDYNSGEGLVLLMDRNGELIDSFTYSDDMHFPVLKNTRGVSLERISFKNNDWHSAAATAGFATPGYINSLSDESFLGESAFFVDEGIFSPDGDGYCDVLAMHYRSERTGTVLSLNVFDLSGRHLKTVVDHQLVGADSEFFWDGLTDERQQLRQGMYVLAGEAYDLNGWSEKFRKALYLTRVK